MENSWLNALITLRVLLIGSTSGLAWMIIFVLIFSAILYTVWRQLMNGKIESNYLICLVLGLLPIFNSALFHTWDAKFMAISLPWLYILIAHTLQTYVKIPALQTLAAASLLLPGLTFFFVSLPISDWRGLDAYINRHCAKDKKQILIYNHFIDKLLLNRYYEGCVLSIPYASKNELNEWDKSVIKENYLRFPHSEEEVSAWIKENNINSFEELFLLKTDDVGVEMEPVLKKHGWQLAEIERAYAPVGKTLLRYVNNRQER